MRNLIDIASKGGNYLLNVGPTAEGIIPAPEVERLSAMGRWLRVNGASIYGTTASPFKRQSWGRCTKRIDADVHTTLYLEVFHWPDDGRLTVPVLNSITRCRLLADPTNTFHVSGDAKNGRALHLTAKAPHLTRRPSPHLSRTLSLRPPKPPKRTVTPPAKAMPPASCSRATQSSSSKVAG